MTSVICFESSMPIYTHVYTTVHVLKSLIHFLVELDPHITSFSQSFPFHDEWETSQYPPTRAQLGQNNRVGRGQRIDGSEYQ
jgi:hypothetical protein